MKKQLVIGIFLTLVLTTISLMPNSIAGPFKVDLIAGHNTDIGDVLISNDGALYVRYNLVAPWYLLETDVHVGDALTDFPVNKGGNPAPGRFDFKMFFEKTEYKNDYTEPIPITGFPGTIIIIAAHAVVYNSETGQTFSAWGDGIRFNPRGKGSFGTYFTYTITGV